MVVGTEGRDGRTNEGETERGGRGTTSTRRGEEIEEKEGKK
jgi:hypothetical protein